MVTIEETANIALPQTIQVAEDGHYVKGAPKYGQLGRDAHKALFQSTLDGIEFTNRNALEVLDLNGLYGQSMEVLLILLVAATVVGPDEARGRAREAREGLKRLVRSL